MPFRIKKAVKIDGKTRIWNVGEQCAGVFRVFFDVPFIEGESDFDLWMRVVEHFKARLDHPGAIS